MAFLLAFLSVGCGNAAGNATPTKSDTDLFSSPIATPANTTFSSPASVPEIEFVPTPLPTPGEGRGSVMGRLIDRETGETITGLAVYLADMGPTMIMIQQYSSPHVIPDVEGYFALLDVEPKEYAIVLWTPHSSNVASDPDGSPYTVEVEAGKVTDVGDLRVVRP
jgi:hypothetical protein